jgi:hypothetical protein
MVEAWFDANHWAWLPGTLLGVLGGCWGAAVGVLGPRGKGRAGVLAAGWLLLAASAVLLTAGVVALVTGQPYGVWYGLGLAGVIGVIVLGVNLPVAVMAYRAAEERRMTARDLSP